MFYSRKNGKKPEIKEAIKVLYNEDVIDVNTARTVYGKKAFAQFETIDDARDLASKLGVL